MIRMMKNKNGFTLIELLIVISIIAMLSSIVLISLQTARSKSRDAQRIMNMNQVKLALELYRGAHNSYPPFNGSVATRESSCFTGTNADTSMAVAQWSSALTPLVTEGFFSALPKDPLNDSPSNASPNPKKCYAYTPSANSTWSNCIDMRTGIVEDLNNYEYALFFTLENPLSNRLAMNWRNTNANVTPAPIAESSWTGKPHNTCILGPHK